ncbi:MAG: molybdopterin-dependent oxidoreductase [Eggerthellaceae bacterium]|nr:molybdopterin-dependent oxidoreductase [Eggerthellaceae bacterium]
MQKAPNATMTRRSFMKTTALTGAALALGTQMAGSFKGVDRAWAEEASETQMYVSTCHGCIQVCPCRVYVRDGIVVKLEGHPIAPANLGSMCLKGLSQLHTAYSPRRVLYPLKRAGARGAENVAWERISWDEALEITATKIFEAAQKYGTYSFFSSTGGGGGYTFENAKTMCTALGGPNVIEPGCAQCYLPRVAMADLMYQGQNQSVADCSFQEFHRGLSKYEADKTLADGSKVGDEITSTMVVWGAQPSVSQVAQSGRGVADLRAKGCKFVVVDPNYSPDAVKADVWLRVRPGADGGLILSWFRYIFENELYDKEFVKTWTNLPFVIDPDTHLPLLAQEVFPDFTQTTPANTPAYVCFDAKSGELKPFEYMSADVDPEVFWEGDVKGKACKTAGQIYKDAAAPWTLEKAEELCWVPKEENEKAIKIYTDPLKAGKAAGIAHGVATDMEQDASQAPTGLLGLDMVMGYVNKKGAALTQHTRPVWDNEKAEWTPAPPGAPKRPTYISNGSYGSVYGFGYMIGATEEENQRRVAGFQELAEPGSKPYVKNQEALYLHNQLKLDQLGLKNHKGLYHWSHSHIPTVLDAIKTGIPYKPRVWYDMSGNKLAMLGNAESWYEAFDEIDFCVCQYPNLTSFQAEIADVVFPLQEWLENPIPIRNQLNYVFPETQVIHLGETVSSGVPQLKVQNAASKKLNEYIESGGEIVFGAIGATVGQSASASPALAADGQPLSSVNATHLHPFDPDRFKLRFPIGDGVQGSVQEDSLLLKQMVARYGAPDYETFINDVSYQQPDMPEAKDPRFVIPPEIFWQYGQHEVTADDGLPKGFGTESRKCEVYASVLIKMAATGFPYTYPREQEPVDKSIGEEVKAIDSIIDPNLSYPFVGTYSPICWHVEPLESPIEGMPGYDPEYPLVLTSGRVYYFHHGTMRHAPFIRELYPVPDVRMHPNTAEKYGLKHMDWVKITSRRSSTTGRVYITRGMDERVIFMERFWNPECFDNAQPNKTGGWRECNVNVLTKNTAPFNEVFGSYTNRGFTVRIERGQKPVGVWVDPKEFEPFLPKNDNQCLPGIGSALEMDPNSPNVEFNDWARG